MAAEEQPSWFIGHARVMMAFANAGNFGKARDIAVELDEWLDKNGGRHSEAIGAGISEFELARSEVAAILKHWP